MYHSLIALLPRTIAPLPTVVRGIFAPLPVTSGASVGLGCWLHERCIYREVWLVPPPVGQARQSYPKAPPRSSLFPPPLVSR